MYILDFIKRISRTANIPIFIYFILNIFVIGIVIYIFFNGNYKMSYWESLLIGILLYLISLAIALSPLGEYILRMQTGCKKIKRVEYLDYLKPIFDEVYSKAKLKDPNLLDDINLFMNEDEYPNAFATGRKTICITKGLLKRPQDEIKAALAHEFGHLSNKDTDLILVICVGNLIFTTMVTIIKFVMLIAGVILSLHSNRWGYIIRSVATIFLINAVMYVWTKIGTLLVMTSSRSNEFEADKFAFDLGY